MEPLLKQVELTLSLSVILVMFTCAKAWTGEIHGRVIRDVCGDSSIGPEDHVLQGIRLEY